MKKLVLYSDQVPALRATADKELKNLFTKSRPTVGFIPSASDPARKYFNDRKAFYSPLGLDMNVYFELDNKWEPERLEQLLACDAIHLSGGNTYYFLVWLRKRKMIPVLKEYVAAGGILIGVSAGAILMTPDITTSSLCGDELVPGETDFSGLGLVDFAFVPHFGYGGFTLDDVRKYAREKHTSVYVARDTGAIIINGDKIKCIGDVIKVG
jgi:dipeptidase E